MEFPITRERLQNYKNGEAKEREITKRVNEMIHHICNQIETTVLTTSEKRCIYSLKGKLAYNLIFNCLMIENNGIQLPPNGLLPQLVEALKEKCVGCDIIVDPLNTYIIIDWS